MYLLHLCFYERNTIRIYSYVHIKYIITVSFFSRRLHHLLLVSHRILQTLFFSTSLPLPSTQPALMSGHGSTAFYLFFRSALLNFKIMRVNIQLHGFVRFIRHRYRFLFRTHTNADQYNIENYSFGRNPAGVCSCTHSDPAHPHLHSHVNAMRQM